MPSTMPHGDPRRLGASRGVAVAGTIIVSGLAALSLVQNLVLNPLAAVPGRGLHQIRADVEAAGESWSLGWTVGPPLLGVALAVALTVLVFRSSHTSGRRRATEPAPTTVSVGMLSLIALAGPGHWWAAFGPGLALADTYGIAGGDHSPWSLPIYSAAALAVVATAALLLRPGGTARSAR